MEARNILIALCKKCNGDWDRMYRALMNKEYMELEIDEEKLESDKYVTLLDADYPQDLKKTFKPPFVLERSAL